ncbi:MAG: nucleoside triphosphate pyrophosphohydrolase [Micavibrio sp.]|nr:MAG: nucleoside triphosphate pyrophosphohydrolase [Micavibrio sp.]
MTHPIEDLIKVMAALRNPDGGCPWDLEQDFKSIAPYTIEEAYEVADAIEREDMADLREELGDLLLQPIYHAQMASEDGLFDINDVIRDVTAKMISRHPHVFGDTDAQTPEDVNKIWDEKKSKEKSRDSVLEGVALGLPALLRAEKLLNKAAKVGFEWEKPEDVLDKFEEELAEMREALKDGTIAEKTDELGDLMFLLVNFGRMLGINAETALRECNGKFERRFKGLESYFKVKNQDLKDVTLREMEAGWQAQKRKETD